MVVTVSTICTCFHWQYQSTEKKSIIGLFLVRHLVSCPKEEEEEENLAKMALLFIDRILPMQGEETRWECTKSEFSPCQSMSSQHRKGH
ncbi:hypothetical protein T09_6123 [Trichinella sp. T9]|nr:hypothetical protein T09_6123 [Trichinella sp. T9]